MAIDTLHPSIYRQLSILYLQKVQQPHWAYMIRHANMANALIHSYRLQMLIMSTWSLYANAVRSLVSFSLLVQNQEFACSHVHVVSILSWCREDSKVKMIF